MIIIAGRLSADWVIRHVLQGNRPTASFSRILALKEVYSKITPF